MKVQVIVRASRVSRRSFITYRFSSMESARAFIAKFDLEDKIIDILS